MKIYIIIFLFAFIGFVSRAQTVKQIEYFIDTDKGTGKNKKVNVTLKADSSFTFQAALSGVSSGYHKLYIRAKASNGKWGLSVRKNIEVFASQTYSDIATGEYFFDTDKGFGKNNLLTINASDTAVLQNFNVAASGLSLGYHKLYIRVKDSDGKWSESVRKNVEVIKSQDTAKIVAAEYFFTKDLGMGKATQKKFTTPLVNGTFTFKIPYNQIPTNADTLFIRVNDTDAKWSLTKISRFSVQTLLADANSKEAANLANNTSTAAFAISVNPNPVAGSTLTLSIHHTAQLPTHLQMNIYSADGKLVVSQKIISDKSLTRQINVSSLKKGIYMLSVNDGAQMRTVKFTKE